MRKHHHIVRYERDQDGWWVDASANFQDAMHEAWSDPDGPGVTPATPTPVADSRVADTLRALAARSAYASRQPAASPICASKTNAGDSTAAPSKRYGQRRAWGQHSCLRGLLDNAARSAH
jgi:hypothetical protein